MSSALFPMRPGIFSRLCREQIPASLRGRERIVVNGGAWMEEQATGLLGKKLADWCGVMLQGLGDEIFKAHRGRRASDLCALLRR